jgi:hypothetical protein
MVGGRGTSTVPLVGKKMHGGITIVMARRGRREEGSVAVGSRVSP